jgi:branched-chain amino acid transport system permease protein
MGSIPGIILGSFVLKGLPELLREIEDYRLLAFGALLVFMMIVRPEGLWPSKRRQLEMSEVDLPPETDALQVLEEQASDQKLGGEK